MSFIFDQILQVCMFNLDLLMNTIICHPIYIHIIRTILRVNNKCDKIDKQVLMDHDQSIFLDGHAQGPTTPINI